MNSTEKYTKILIHIFKLIIIGILLGVVGGILGSIFHFCIDYVTILRENNYWMILLLPVGGLVISFVYGKFTSKGNIDTKRVFQSVNENRDVPVVMMPLIFIGTVITHAFGGSAGREGAALQLGGSMGYNIGKALKQKENDLKLLVASGMSSVFSAMFGTPFAAAVFSLEVTILGIFNWRGILTCVISSVVSFITSEFLGTEAVRFDMPAVSEYSIMIILKVIILALLCAGVCVIFATAIKKAEKYAKKYITNSCIRVVAGGAIIVLLTVIIGTTDYNGAGMNIIERAVSGEVRSSAFIMKILFTAITVAVGFKGGEIVPTFFIGATFGCVAGQMMGIDGGMCAALGFIALFSGMTKCPAAAFLMAMEVFGAKAIPLFIIVVFVTYYFSGNFGLYDNKTPIETN